MSSLFPETSHTVHWFNSTCSLPVMLTSIKSLALASLQLEAVNDMPPSATTEMGFSMALLLPHTNSFSPQLQPSGIWKLAAFDEQKS